MDECDSTPFIHKFESLYSLHFALLYLFPIFPAFLLSVEPQPFQASATGLLIANSNVFTMFYHFLYTDEIAHALSSYSSNFTSPLNSINQFDIHIKESSLLQRVTEMTDGFLYPRIYERRVWFGTNLPTDEEGV